MSINADKPHLWKVDVERSIDFYNDWFLRFAPETFREQRGETAKFVEDALKRTSFLGDISPEVLRSHPGVLATLRMVCAPPLARDRLIGLAYLNKNLVLSMEGKPGVPPRIPPRMPKQELNENLQRLCDTIGELVDHDIFPWLKSSMKPKKEELARASMIIADRLCGAASDPIIRNAQEKRQLEALSCWLEAKGYRNVVSSSVQAVQQLSPGEFAFRMNVSVGAEEGRVNIPIDCVVQPYGGQAGDMPVLLEAKSAGDATNTNKRRKEEAQKFSQLKAHFGESIRYVLFLCGYFEPGYLGYEASEGIDWIWEHRLSDLDHLFPASPDINGIEIIREESGTYTVSDRTREVQRHSLQNKIDRSKAQADRNRMGQFSTPYSLAVQITQQAFEYLEPDSSFRFLEPALGSGVFFSALESMTEGGLEIIQATGVELDAEYSAIAEALWSCRPFEVLTDDYLEFCRCPDRRNKYDMICTNPPYVRHHHLGSATKKELCERIERELGLVPSGLSGLYVYFMLISHTILKDDAVASWLIPSEFLSVNYGSVLRDYLLNCVSLKRIHQFDPANVQFDDALVSSCVVTYVKTPPKEDGAIEFSYGGTLEQPLRTRMQERSELSPSDKWLVSSTVSTAIPGHGSDGPSFGDLFTVKRGIATGANSFFIVNKKTVDEFDIPTTELRPILPSPRHLEQYVIAADEKGDPNVPRLRYLLDCRMSPESIANNHPGLWRYLCNGESSGVANGYICSNRKTWYFQDQRAPALYLATYMARSNGDEAENPFRFFLNLSDAIATNVYLMLYPKPVVMTALQGRKDRMLDLLKLLNSLTRRLVVEGGRTYGGGLHKLEPKELANLRLPMCPEWLRLDTQPELQLWQTTSAAKRRKRKYARTE